MHRLSKLFLELFIFLGVLFVCGCSSSPIPRNVPVSEKKDVSSVEARYAANELGAQQVAEIRFPRGSNRIDRSEIRKLEAAIAKAERDGAVEEIKLVAWADREYPSFNSGSLPKQDQELAEKRNAAMKKAVEGKLSDAEIDTYNMAVYPNGVERLLKTSDFRVKRALEQAGVPNTDAAVKTPAMAGKGLVMILLEKKARPEAE